MSIRQGNKIIAGNVDNTDYTALLNKPQINSIELSGNKTLEELGIQASGDYATTEDTNEIKENYNKLDNQKTNCLTKIPQDIKLELSEDGTLTLKAGSKVYVPNGFESDGITPKFDSIIIDQDYSRDAKVWIGLGYITYSTGGIDWASINLVDSNENEPENKKNAFVWYDLTTNTIKRYNGTNWYGNHSFPIAIINANSNVNDIYIDQIFNGFGYIGNTVFALPNVECLIPNGRNEDGSLKNIKTILNNVRTYNIINNPSSDVVLQINKTSLGIVDNRYYKNVNVLPSYTSLNGWSVYYLNTDNYMYVGKSDTPWAIQKSMIFGKLTTEKGRIISFEPKNIFQSVDINNTEWASTASKPSNNYVDITVDATGSTYTALENGWFGAITQNSSMCNLHNNQSNGNFCVYNMESNVISDRASYIPVNKGDNITFYYNGSVLQFRFYYDNGTK